MIFFSVFPQLFSHQINILLNNSKNKILIKNFLNENKYQFIKKKFNIHLETGLGTFPFTDPIKFAIGL